MFSGSQQQASSETTPLKTDVEGGNASDNQRYPPADSERLWKEMDQPWPSTFDRAISLLASPVIRAKDAELYTKSPKPGSTAVALARRNTLDRGFYTPEHSFMPSLLRRRDNLSDRDLDIAAVRRAHAGSFDLSSTKVDVAFVQQEQDKKAKEAAAYRAKILQDAQQLKTVRHDTEIPVDANGKSSFMQCAFNLANILMGVGLLGLAFVMKSAGWMGGLGALLSLAFVTWRTSILIGRELNGDPRPSHSFDDSPYKSPLKPGSTPRARMYAPISSFPAIARLAFGDTGNVILSVILYFELFSCICVFLVTIGDHLHQIFPAIPSQHLQCLTAAASMIPTIFLHTPALLSYLSMVGTFATVCVVLSVIAAAVVEGNITEEVAVRHGLAEIAPYHKAWDPSGLTLALGLVAYCFSGHAIVPSIYVSMAKPQEFERMVTFTYVVVVVCCAAVGLSGYYIFGGTVADQITLSLEQNSSAVTAMKALTWLMIMTAFSKITLTMFPLAIGMEEIVAPYLTSEKMVDFSAGIIKLVLTALALVVAIFVPSFSFLCALVGMVCTMAVSVVFPAGAYLKMFWSRLSWWDRILNWIFVVVGLILSVAGTIATLG